MSYWLLSYHSCAHHFYRGNLLLHHTPNRSVCTHHSHTGRTCCYMFCSAWLSDNLFRPNRPDNLFLRHISNVSTRSSCFRRWNRPLCKWMVLKYNVVHFCYTMTIIKPYLGWNFWGSFDYFSGIWRSTIMLMCFDYEEQGVDGAWKDVLGYCEFRIYLSIVFCG